MNYATKEDVALWMGYETADGVADLSLLPDNIEKLLRDASSLIDYATMNRIGLTNERHMDAAMMATAAQIEYWIDGVGESVDINPGISSYTAGSTSFQFVGGQMPKLAPRARRELWSGGLLNRTVARS